MADTRIRRRQVRSYVLREGRLTRGQNRALAQLWQSYGLDLGEPLDLPTVFGRRAPTCLEIGFGDGEALLASAKQSPQHDFIGVEVHRPGVGRLLLGLEAENITNVRVFCADAVAVLRDAILPNALREAYLYFPDPWPKKRHHKRRLVQPDFVELLVTRLQPGGKIYFATDWAAYAEHALGVFNACPQLENRAQDRGFSPRPKSRPQTKFERRGLQRGHRVWDIVMHKVTG